MKKKFLLFILALLSFGLNAETRIYYYNGAIQDFVQKFIDELSESKLKFQIVKYYNENTDGVLGFRMLILPGRRLVDIRIIDDHQKTTIVKIFYENPWDGKMFHDMFTKLKLKEQGNQNFDDSLPPGWPRIN
ncbi:MAG: hypothetical protein NZ853_04775 [Leptospiraceae bacterium]|nr:hypothetical protein [Leptospiraceae bacterium]MDW7975914.1 hypothetical protein [Leptospiraceae bacterium]